MKNFWLNVAATVVAGALIAVASVLWSMQADIATLKANVSSIMRSQNIALNEQAN